MKRLSSTTCTIQGRYLDIKTEKEINSFSEEYTNLNKVIFNETSQDYNLDELIIKFDPDLNS
jgi:hypothetical protein